MEPRGSLGITGINNKGYTADALLSRDVLDPPWMGPRHRLVDFKSFKKTRYHTR